MALVKAPQIVPRIKEIVLMGGGYFEGGNITPAAEFNIYVDPEAADVVLRSRRPDHHGAARRHPQDALDQARGSTASAPSATSAGVAVAEMLELLRALRPGRSTAGKARRCTTPASSPTCSSPSCSRAAHVNVTIETGSELTVGMTVVDYWGVTDRPKNVFYLRSGDADGFYDLLTERIWHGLP